MSALVLEARQLDKQYGGLHVTRNVSLQLHAGDRLALIGPNGAGKTTLVNLISGTVAPDAGSVWLAGENVTRRSQAQRVRAGLARTFQITTLAPHLPVQRQVELALFEREGLTGRAWRSVDGYPVLAAEAQALLRELGLGEHAGWPTERLAYGEQRLVELALALALRPQVLLLDEPLEGLAPLIRQELLLAFTTMSTELGITVVIVEQQIKEALGYAQRALILNHGVVAHEAPADQLRNDDATLERYIGMAVH